MNFLNPVRKNSSNEYMNQHKNKYAEQPGARPQSLMQSYQLDHGNPRGSTSGGKLRDNVFLPEKHRTNRIDSSGFSFTREHWKRLQNKNKKKESQLIRLFIYNVPKKFSVDHICPICSPNILRFKHLYICYLFKIW